MMIEKLKRERQREDFVKFNLKKTAPDHIALGGRRFNGIFARAKQPFEATRGEWLIFLVKTGYFEEATETQSHGESEKLKAL